MTAEFLPCSIIGRARTFLSGQATLALNDYRTCSVRTFSRSFHCQTWSPQPISAAAASGCPAAGAGSSSMDLLKRQPFCDCAASGEKEGFSLAEALGDRVAELVADSALARRLFR